MGAPRERIEPTVVGETASHSTATMKAGPLSNSGSAHGLQIPACHDNATFPKRYKKTVAVLQMMLTASKTVSVPAINVLESDMRGARSSVG